MREVVTLKEYYISIHALRVEGDRYPEQYDARFEISIHALRVEGDSMREVVTLKEYYISIHALRVEGDVIYIFIFVFVPSISIHALRVEGDPHNMYAIACTHFISIHALRVEGDHPSAKSISKKFYFYPRPPGGGRPFQLSTGLPQKHFYPRPPGGGRRAPFFALCSICRFLSTPSGWRATRTHKITEHHTVFLSTPSGWRATHSIYQDMLKLRYFYPRPPGGGRLSHSMFPRTAETISIHALRVEGDKIAPFVKHLHYISIHALRVEGDKSIFDRLRRRIRNFYPRPPGGGRPSAFHPYTPAV